MVVQLKKEAYRRNNGLYGWIAGGGQKSIVVLLLCVGTWLLFSTNKMLASYSRYNNIMDYVLSTSPKIFASPQEALSKDFVVMSSSSDDSVSIMFLECPPPPTPLAALSLNAKTKYDFSPVLDLVPRYTTSNVSIQIPANCQFYNQEVATKSTAMNVPGTRYKNDMNEKEQGTFLGELQLYIHKYLPLLTTIIPIIVYDECDECKTMTTKILSIREHDADSLSDHITQHQCNRIRGIHGSWEYNATYANASYYTDSNWIMGKQLVHGPYNHSSWMWEESEDSSSYCAPVELMTLDGFCHSMATMNLKRLFVLGDSMEFMRSLSFFHILGIDARVHTHLLARSKMRHETNILCAAANFTVSVVFYRVNHLLPLLTETNTSSSPSPSPLRPLDVVPLSQQEEQKQQIQQRLTTQKDLRMEYFVCYGIRKAIYPDKEGYCPWVKEYLSYDPGRGRTLLLSGVGPHFHSMPAFTEMFDRFVGFLKDHPRPLDIVWLRTVSAGHKGCDKLDDTTPLHSFQTFQEKYASSTLYE
jgi:hypothetical protein